MSSTIPKTADAITSTITVSAGPKTNTRGTRLAFSSVADLARQLEAHPATVEAWWSPHVWTGNARAAAAWEAASTIGIDLDAEGHADLPTGIANVLDAAASVGEIPGNIYHRTPAGARVVYVLDAPCADRETYQRAAVVAAEQVARALSEMRLSAVAVDPKPVTDLARFFYAPNCTAKGRQRQARVMVMSAEVTSAADLAGRYVEPAPPPASPARPVSPRRQGTDLADAIAAYNRERARELPRNSAPCPMCGGAASFGRLPNSDRWSCFAAGHHTWGVQGDQVWTGDVLDLDACAAGVDRLTLLEASGYWTRPTRAANAPAAVQSAQDPDALVAEEEHNKPLADLTLTAHLGRELATIEKGVRRISTGWPLLDAALGGGVELPSMTVLGAAPKSSKSTWAGIMAERHVAAGGVAYVLDIENGARRVLRRILCRRAELGPSQVEAALANKERGIFDRSQLAKWEEAQTYARERLGGRLLVETRPPGNFDARIREVKEMAAGRPVLMVVDSLQRLPMKNMSERRAGIDEWVDLIERITKEHEIASLLISEIKRDPSGGYKVGEAAFKESSRIEYAADLLLTMARPSIDDDDPNVPTLLRVEAARDVALDTDPRGPVASYVPVRPFYGLNEKPPEIPEKPEKPAKGRSASPSATGAGLRG